tara:strand:- start:163 stop:489 length:327 start_codon:yes stop_codon:yes gene_type:complete
MKKTNKKDNKTFYSLDMNNLNKVPSCDIFGYLMSSIGVTVNTSEEDVVRILYILKNKYSDFALYIDTILTNIIGYGDINDYMEHLTSKQNEFIAAGGELVNVKNNLVV